MDETVLLRERIGIAFKAWMQHARLGPTAIHKQTGISRETIHAIRDGKRVPQIEVLTMIAPLLGTTAGAIMDGIVPPEKTLGLTPLDYGRFSRVEASAAEVEPLAEAVESFGRILAQLVDAVELPQRIRASLQSQLASLRGNP